MGERHVVSALKAKRAELAGEAKVAERHLGQLRADLVHLDAVLRMFDPAPSLASSPLGTPPGVASGSTTGELPRRILDTLRPSPEPPERHPHCHTGHGGQGPRHGRRRYNGLDPQERPELPPAPERHAGCAGHGGADKKGCGG